MTGNEKTTIESEEAPVDGGKLAGDSGDPGALLEVQSNAATPEAAEKVPRERRFLKMPDAYGWWGLGVFAASALATIIVARMFPEDGMVYFRMGALMGALLGFVGAIIRVVAHEIEDDKLDLLGKVIAIFAGVYALMFAFAVLALQIVVPQPLGG